MKTFEVEFIRTSYLEFQVEADDEDDAEEKARELLEESYPNEEEFWQVNYSEEVKTKSEANV